MPTIKHAAERWNTTRQSIWRMRKRGVDVHDVIAVAAYCVEVQVPPLPMIRAVLKELKALPVQPKPDPFITGLIEGLKHP